LWTLQRLCFEPDVAADISDRGENRDPVRQTEESKWLLTKETRLENGRPGPADRQSAPAFYDEIDIRNPG
jgi:hypothetical protein